MPEDYERLDSSIASLSSDIDSGGPYIVHGVAMGAGDITHGGSGKKTLWPKEVLQDAADALEGQPLATDQDHTADDPQPQTPVEAIAGEVTWAGYGEVDGKEGVLYEAELDDKDLAKKVKNGRLDVSPLVARNLEPLEDHDEADYKATGIQAWRDLALVQSGASPSNTIDAGANPAKATALHEAIEALQDWKTVAGVRFRGTKAGELDESEIPNDADFGDYYLYPGENKSDSSYPVVDSNGYLRRSNVDAAWGLGARGGVDSEELDSRLMELAGEFENPPEWAQDGNSGSEANEFGWNATSADVWAACSMQVPESAARNDDPSGASSSTSDSLERETMSDNDNSESELSDTEREVLRAAEDTEDAVEALQSYTDAEDPVIVEQTDYESLTEQVDVAKDLYAESLSQRWDTDKDKIKDNFGLEALREEFETEDGDLNREALVQNPQTGQPTDKEEGESGVEALEDEQVAKAERLYADYEMMSNPPASLKDRITEALEMDDFDSAMEVLD